MFKYQKFLIRPTDHFDAATYPFLEEKISFAKKELEAMPAAHRTEMLVSFLKEHRIKSEWVANNPELAKLINSKVLPLTDFEALFESGKENTAFVKELEAYIKEQFAVAPVVPHLPEEIN
jgi:hypothetical protein